MFSKEKNLNDWHLSGFGNAPATLFQSLESTHSLMKARAAAGKILPGTLIVADTQTAGRGRHERTWASPAGLNLYFNILIPLDGIPLASAPQITQVAALTFAEVFRGLQDDANAQGKGNLSAQVLRNFGGTRSYSIGTRLPKALHQHGRGNQRQWQRPRLCPPRASRYDSQGHLRRTHQPRKTFASAHWKSRTRHRTVPCFRDSPLGCRVETHGPVHRRPRNYRRKCTLHRRPKRCTAPI